MSETRKALLAEHTARMDELGWQHPAICLAEAAITYDAPEAMRERAMGLALDVLQNATL